ncbi:hypothetical protein Barb7_02615 [Bacteroidales bacterium Barb7]|nr:hypothetical protein Barb7_02615 [Bacteroidales bacterium Barb7]
MKDWDIHIYRGILTGYNEAFIIDGKKKDELIAEDPKSAEIIRPILRGKDIKRYGYDFADKWLINTHNGIKEKDIKSISIGDYPAIKNHLDKHYSELEKRTDKGDTPYNLRNCAYMEDFYKQKIVFQEMVQEPSFMFDKDGTFFCLDTGRIITGNEIDYLISILNSKLFFFAVKKFYGGGGLGESGVRMKHTFFENFCFPILEIDKQQALINLSKSALEQHKSSEFHLIEKRINDLVYQLYNLSYEEIMLIEAQ